jgi:hypothetical protein
VSAPVVFAGFGVVAPELHHDDYAKVDVHGKIVMILSGAPANFPTDQRAFYSGSHLKERVAAQHGAVGLLSLNTITDEKRSPFENARSRVASRQCYTSTRAGQPTPWKGFACRRRSIALLPTSSSTKRRCRSTPC